MGVLAPLRGPLSGSLNLTVKLHTLFQLHTVYQEPVGVGEVLIPFTALLQKELVELQGTLKKVEEEVILFLIRELQEALHKGFRGYLFLLVQVQELLWGVRGFCSQGGVPLWFSLIITR